MTPPVATTAAPSIGPAVTTRDVVAAYVGLTKPRIIELLLVTTIPTMFLAGHSVPSLSLLLVTMVGGYLAAGSANTFNNVIDSDIDAKMRRTRTRTLPRHRVGRTQAAVFGAVLAVLSALILGLGANWLSAWLALLANAFYVFVYTMWLKRRTSQNIVWGGIAGCFPPLIGWTAVTGRVDWAPFVLFLVVFFWTPPHTWALAWRYREDYEAGGVPMLPVVAPPVRVATQILVYTVITVAVSLTLWPLADTGLLYPVVAALAGALFIVEAVGLLRRARAGGTDVTVKPMRLFHWSNSYLSVLFLAAAISPLLPW